MAKLPEGDRPILNPGIARTRYLPMFRIAGQQQLYPFTELLKRVGIRLELPPGDAPYLVPNQPLEGVYATGKTFKINKASLFTNTSKMPGPSFAIPAGPPAFGGTCPAAALGENVARSREVLTQRVRQGSGKRGKAGAGDPNFTFKQSKSLPMLGDAEPAKSGLVEGVERSYDGDAAFTCRSCYALNGNYNYPSKQVNDMLHLAWVEHELEAGGPMRLGTALAYAIQHVNLTRKEGFQPYFRIHDAGDFYSPEYLEAWVACASMMTHMRFWAPTRQWVFAKWVPLLIGAEERVRAAGGWLTIRASVLRIGDPVPMIPGLSAGSGVSADDPCAWVCPVYNKVVPRPQPDGSVVMTEAGACLEAGCTMCWDQPAIPVSYGAH
jgi:hypothetical protein